MIKNGYIFDLFNMIMLFGMVVVLNIMMAVYQLAGVRIYPKVLKISQKILLPVVLILSYIGSYAVAGQSISSGIYYMGIALVMGFVGYVLKKDGYPIAPIVLGLILGGMFEENFRRAVKLAGGTINVAVATMAIFFAVGFVFLRLADRYDTSSGK